MNKINFAIVLFCVLFNTACKNENQIIVNNITGIKSYLSDFYNKYERFFENKEQNARSYFFDNKIEFYIQDNNTLDSEYATTNSDFLFIIKKFREKSGKILRFKLDKVSFENTIYDIPENNLFVAHYNVTYENLITFETFILKKLSDTTYKIYRYFIIYECHL